MTPAVFRVSFAVHQPMHLHASDRRAFVACAWQLLLQPSNRSMSCIGASLQLPQLPNHAQVTAPAHSVAMHEGHLLHTWGIHGVLRIAARGAAQLCHPVVVGDN